MNWLARRRLTAALRRLGRRPKWGRAFGDRYAWCPGCGDSWDGEVTSIAQVTAELSGTPACGGRL